MKVAITTPTNWPEVRRGAERFANELHILRFLEERGCDFVPRVLEADPETLKLVTTNCGARVEP